MTTHEPGGYELAVTLGRIEEMLKSMNEKLDKLESVNETHADVLRKHEVSIRLLEQRQGPRVPFITWVIGAVAVIGLFISIADRLWGAP